MCVFVCDLAHKSLTHPDSVDPLIENPITCGFLLAFCESQYSAENLRYLMEIDRYRDDFAMDTTSWGQIPWRQIDKNVGINAGENVSFEGNSDHPVIGGDHQWPSTAIHRESIISHINFIWDNYLSDNASNQICMPSKVLYNTKRRLELLHLYGKQVFDETVIDPIKTMNRDILPRFLASEYFVRMKARLENIEVLPQSSSLSIPPPSTSSVIEGEVEPSLESLTVDIITLIHDRVLYNDFLAYLRSIVSSENLLCLRAIAIFQGQWDGEGKGTAMQRMQMQQRNNSNNSLNDTGTGRIGSMHGSISKHQGGHSVNSQLDHKLQGAPAPTSAAPPAAEEMAWDIYLYFVATGNHCQVYLLSVFFSVIFSFCAIGSVKRC